MNAKWMMLGLVFVAGCASEEQTAPKPVCAHDLSSLEREKCAENAAPEPVLPPRQAPGTATTEITGGKTDKLEGMPHTQDRPPTYTPPPAPPPPPPVRTPPTGAPPPPAVPPPHHG